MPQYKILLLEEDMMLGDTIRELLEQNGYLVDLANDGEVAVELAFDIEYDMYIFDINVPLMDGFELLSSLRHAEDTTPTLFISAMTDIQTMTKGFTLGAEDFIKKPFFPEELLLRVNAKMAKLQNEIICKELRYNPQTQELFKNNSPLFLSPMLTSMLHLFLTHQGQLVLKEQLLDCMEHPNSSALRVALTKLKQQTGLGINNIRGVGYSLETC